MNLYDVPGIYIMVLDKYKQIYIGKSKSIKKRILQHWHNNKEFDRLIFGSVKTSVLSIDSFRALDTTRLFILPINELYQDNIEEKIVNLVNEKFLLNRVNGGNLFCKIESIDPHYRVF